MQVKQIFAPEEPEVREQRQRTFALRRALESIESIKALAPEAVAALDTAATVIAAERTAIAKSLPPMQLLGINIQRAGRHQKFSPSFLDDGEARGVITRERGLITIHGTDGDVVYRIATGPGLYCCHCDERLGDVGESGVGAAHVRAYHPNTPSPDHHNPAGYRGDNSFQCVLVGDEVTMTPEAAAESWRGVREALNARTEAKHTRARENARTRAAAKQSTTTEG